MQADPAEDAVESRAARTLTALVDRLPLVVMCVFIAAALCATFELMTWWLFLPVAALLLGLTWRALPHPPPTERGHLAGSAIAIGGAFVWYLVNSPFASEYLVPIRDPGLYFLNGVVIAQTGGTDIDVGGAADAVRALGDGTVSLGAFGAKDGVVQLQGSSGYPALLAIGYWIAGLTGVTQVNLIVGAIGLIALYGLARRLMSPRIALIPPAILAIGMPYIYLSRTTYTEVLACLLLVAAGTWIASAFESRRLDLFVVAGLFIGAAGLTRIDGAVGFVGVAFGMVLLLLGTVGREKLAAVLPGALTMVSVAVALLGLGMLDLALNHQRYLVLLSSEAIQLWLGAAALILTMVVLVFARRRWTLDSSPTVTRRVAVVATVALSGLLIFWLSRPLWMVSRRIGPGYQGEVAMLQAKDGLAIDPARSYDELSLSWFAWYWGWPFLILACIGVALWLHRALVRRDGAQIIIIAMIGLAAMLYINTLRVTPDQVWAIRRLLPMITPGLLLGAAFTIEALWRRTTFARVTAIVAMALTVVFSGLTWGKIFFSVEGSGQVREIESICTAVGDAQLVVLTELGTPPNYPATLRAVCGKQVVTLNTHEGMDLRLLAGAGSHSTAIVTFDQELVDWKTVPASPVAYTELHMWNRHLLDTPRTTQLTVRSVFVGHLDADGRAFAVSGR